MASRVRSAQARAIEVFALLCIVFVGAPLPIGAQHGSWPEITRTCRPWSYWWWMGSAVDRANLARELQLYADAGFGGMHVIPIYGAKGYEKRYLRYLSPPWMAAFRTALTEASDRDLGIDLTLGSGWCFGGPQIPAALANARVQHRVHRPRSGARFELQAEQGLQAIVAYGPKERVVDLGPRVSTVGRLSWRVPAGEWEVYEVWQRPSGRKVKRAAPGGEGWMLNPFSKRATARFLEPLTAAFPSGGARKGMPRAVYHDSYEYIADWSPGLLRAFEARRGYALTKHLPSLFSDDDRDDVRRVKADYRRTLDELMVEDFNGTWLAWARARGCLTRNEAHGSPGNLLDLYAAADIPETEFFRFDRNPLVAKFASSAAHVAGRPLVSAETGTWLDEHFHVTLGQLKCFIDGLFVSGINHIFYHGSCYSPASAPWPGWVFYASTQMNPRNAIWRDVPALNAYVARCQSVLQHGRPDNDVLLYWPIHDDWHDAKGLVRPMTVHKTEWLTRRAIGSVASALWSRGFAFDYASDRQLEQSRGGAEGIRTPGASYRVLVVPPATHVPITTYESIMKIARAGADVVFVGALPRDVPGLHALASRRARRAALLAELRFDKVDGGRMARLGRGRVFVADVLETVLQSLGVARESLVDQDGLRCVRRRDAKGTWYFVTNQSAQFEHSADTAIFDGFLPFAKSAENALLFDPRTGARGIAAIRAGADGRGAAVRLRLGPGESRIVYLTDEDCDACPRWPYFEEAGRAVRTLDGAWDLEFLEGGPSLPSAQRMAALASWTQNEDPEAKRFAGTARYRTRFAVSDAEQRWRLDLGDVAESARVRINGRELAALFCKPFLIDIPAALLREGENVLEVDVTNLSVNRLRDLDTRKVEWRIFRDINFVNRDYKPFDASKWPIRRSGLLGPVRLVAIRERKAR